MANRYRLVVDAFFLHSISGRIPSPSHNTFRRNAHPRARPICYFKTGPCALYFDSQERAARLDRLEVREGMVVMVTYPLLLSPSRILSNTSMYVH